MPEFEIEWSRDDLNGIWNMHTVEDHVFCAAFQRGTLGAWILYVVGLYNRPISGKLTEAEVKTLAEVQYRIVCSWI